MENTKIILTQEESISHALDTVWVGAIKNKLQEVVDFSKSLNITDFEDDSQFEVVKRTKIWYVKTRNTIKRAFKFKRDDYNSLAKANLEAEREVIAVIELEEKRLDDMVQKAELLKLRKENEKVIEDRIEALKKCWVVWNREELLEIKEKEFENILTEARLKFVKEEEERIEEEKQKIAREKEIEEARKQARIEAEKEKQEKLEKETKYKEFLAKNEWNFDKIFKEDWKIILYKKVDEFLI